MDPMVVFAKMAEHEMMCQIFHKEDNCEMESCTECAKFTLDEISKLKEDFMKRNSMG